MTNWPIGKLYVINGITYALRKAGPQTAEQQAATLTRQATCQHDKGVHFTDPLTCRLCEKVMP